MKSLRVLIADDDGLTLMVLRKILVAMAEMVEAIRTVHQGRGYLSSDIALPWPSGDGPPAGAPAPGTSRRRWAQLTPVTASRRRDRAREPGIRVMAS